MPPVFSRDYQSAFQRAFHKYINDLPENKQKKNFISACYDSSRPITPDSVLDSFKKIEASRSQKSSMISKIIKKVVSALKDYDAIVKTLGKLPVFMRLCSQAYLSTYAASADPMPTAIIWGALSVVIDVSPSCVYVGAFELN